MAHKETIFIPCSIFGRGLDRLHRRSNPLDNLESDMNDNYKTKTLRFCKLRKVVK